MKPAYKRTLGVMLVSLYVLALLLPLYIFFHDRGGTEWLTSLTPKAALQLLFPLLGLYAFTFVSWQVLLATNLRWLRRLWPKIINFHRFQGGFALLFAVLHPSFMLIGFGLLSYLHGAYLPSSLHWWLLPAYTALTIMLGTTSTALLAWRGRNIPWWRKLHRLNYAVFCLVWLHSWFVGSDVHGVLLRTVWIIYLAAVLASTIGRYYSKWKQLLDRPAVSNP